MYKITLLIEITEGEGDDMKNLVDRVLAIETYDLSAASGLRPGRAINRLYENAIIAAMTKRNLDKLASG